MSRHDADEDPTGVRALLSSLPDPGPMPDDLVARISASIATEHAGRAATPVDGAGTAGRDVVTPLPIRFSEDDEPGSADSEATGATVVPLRRGRRWTAWVALAGAAASVGVVTLTLQGLGGNSATSSVGAAFGSVSPSTPADEAAAASAASGPTTPADSALSTASALVDTATKAEPVRVMVDDTPYTKDTLTALTPASRMAQGTAARSALGPAATVPGATACVRGVNRSIPSAKLPVDSRSTVVIGTYDGAPATFVVATAGGVTSIYPLQRQCTADHAVLLAPVITR